MREKSFEQHTGDVAFRSVSVLIKGLTRLCSNDEITSVYSFFGGVNDQQQNDETEQSCVYAVLREVS